MAEVALGVLGLAGIFSTALDVWAFVDAGQGFAKSFDRIRTKLDLERTNFVLWGQGLGFGSPDGYDPRLDDESIRPVLEQTLKQIYLLFSDTDELVKTYGIRIVQLDGTATITRPLHYRELTTTVFRNKYNSFRLALRHVAGRQGGGQVSRTGPRTSRPAATAGQAQYASYSETMARRQNSASLWLKARWGIRDEVKMEKLVRDLSDYVRSLERLTDKVINKQLVRELAQEAVDDIEDTDTLQEIEDQSEISSSLSNAASIRLVSLKSERQSGTSSAYFSARSRLTSNPESVYGTNPGTRFFSSPPPNERCRNTDQEAAYDSWPPQDENTSPETRSLSVQTGTPVPRLSGTIRTAPGILLPFRFENVVTDHSGYLRYRITVGPLNSSISLYKGEIFDITVFVETNTAASETSIIRLQCLTAINHPLVGRSGWLNARGRLRYVAEKESVTSLSEEIVHFILVFFHYGWKQAQFPVRKRVSNLGDRLNLAGEWPRGGARMAGYQNSCRHYMEFVPPATVADKPAELDSSLPVPKYVPSLRYGHIINDIPVLGRWNDAISDKVLLFSLSSTDGSNPTEDCIEWCLPELVGCKEKDSGEFETIINRPRVKN